MLSLLIVVSHSIILFGFLDKIKIVYLRYNLLISRYSSTVACPCVWSIVPDSYELVKEQNIRLRKILFFEEVFRKNSFSFQVNAGLCW
jgi:hypothetical protein